MGPREEKESENQDNVQNDIQDYESEQMEIMDGNENEKEIIENENENENESENEDSNKQNETQGTKIQKGKKKTKSKKPEIARPVPKWLLSPTYVDQDIANGTLVENMTCLSQEMIDRLHSQNIFNLFPGYFLIFFFFFLKKFFNFFFLVQSVVIPELMKGSNMYYNLQDFCVSAPTGSGKTLAYAIPMVEVILLFE